MIWGIEGYERELFEQLKMLDPDYCAQQSAEARAFHEQWKKIGADALEKAKRDLNDPVPE